MSNPVQDGIRNTVADNEVVLFMKGTRFSPQCGFSSRIASVLSYLEVDFKDINVLDDEGVRQGIKEFSDWPTIPQLYVRESLSVGCDIVTEMTLSGELDVLLEDKSISFSKDAADRIREHSS